MKIAVSLPVVIIAILICGKKNIKSKYGKEK